MEIARKQRGRPPAFNQEEALEKAMQLFWEHGYEGTSVAELAAVMGINKPSLYGTFGDKESLFRKALQRYLSGPVAYVAASLQEPTARRVVERFLTASVALLTEDDHRRGCLVVQGALTCGQGAELIRQELIAQRKAYEAGLQKRFELARLEQDLSQDTDAAALARLIATLHQGLSVQASSGAGRDELMEVVRMALKYWPLAA